jgi:hypothetical protein
MPTGVLLLLLVPYFLCSEITEMLPGILNQLGADSLTHLKLSYVLYTLFAMFRDN